MGTPTGTVQFRDGATNLGGTVTLSGGTATLATSALTPGAHSITAVYATSTNHNTSTSPALTQTVGGRPTTTAVNCASPTVVGTATTCTFTVTDTGGAGATSPTGAVTPSTNSSGAFSDATCTLAAAGANAASGTLFYTPASRGSGSHGIGATYGGDANHGASTATAFSLAVNTAWTSILIASSADPSTYGLPVTF